MKRWILLFIGLMPMMTTTSALAFDTKGCSIWLCLPTGFPSGCGDAKSEFKKRILKGKSPMPSFSSCALNSPNTPSTPGTSNISTKEGRAALISARKTCVKSTRERQSNGDYQTICLDTKVIPAHAIKNTSCVVTKDKGESAKRTPSGCTRTIRFVDTFMDGKPYGETYYFDGSGNEINL
ncbi:hypothetical protein [Vibrio scophthalmi]|uniref:Sex pilus assembly and synthesis protein n=1 Tax=Vibrio scophthalmi LMG 19158 TaxID=870967 RepID=F9RIF4_9VIBR|nr:hypothetical protein [Vibrio scophthalmi]EGU42486.1 sex pilus assembly and synthesis protein [Vibrio scophthalmi LMG 19158]